MPPQPSSTIFFETGSFNKSEPQQLVRLAGNWFLVIFTLLSTSSGVTGTCRGPTLGAMHVQQAFVRRAISQTFGGKIPLLPPYTNPRGHVFTYHPKQAPSIPGSASGLPVCSVTFPHSLSSVLMAVYPEHGTETHFVWFPTSFCYCSVLLFSLWRWSQILILWALFVCLTVSFCFSTSGKIWVPQGHIIIFASFEICTLTTINLPQTEVSAKSINCVPYILIIIQSMCSLFLSDTYTHTCTPTHGKSI